MPPSTLPSISQKHARTVTSTSSSTHKQRPQTAPGPARQTASPRAPSHQSRKSLSPLWLEARTRIAFWLFGETTTNSRNPKNTTTQSTQKTSNCVLGDNSKQLSKPIQYIPVDPTLQTQLDNNMNNSETNKIREKKQL